MLITLTPPDQCGALESELLTCYSKMSSLADLLSSSLAQRRRERRESKRRRMELVQAFAEAKMTLIGIASEEIVRRKWEGRGRGGGEGE